MRILLLLLSTLFLFSPLLSQTAVLPFDSTTWDLSGATVLEHSGRSCVMGTAVLKSAEFENGIIEVDMMVTGARTYPGIMFRRRDADNYEDFYIRPHRSGFYPDALQYTPKINGLSGWQLYNGNGYTAAAEIPTSEWIPVRIDVQGKRARVFFGDTASAALQIEDLKLGAGSGSFGIYGPRNGTAYFSNVRIRPDADVSFPPPAYQDVPPGLLTDWEISQPFDATTVDLDHAPSADELSGMQWQTITPDHSGVFNLARFVQPPVPALPVVYARTTITTDEAGMFRLVLGYSDIATVFCNGKPVFQGNSSYQSRDRSFLGIVGLNDALALPLRKGQNTVVLSLVETSGGWGFISQNGDAVHEAPGVTKLWESGRVFRIPETVVFDTGRRVLYVSNYDPLLPPTGTGRHALSRVTLDGRILDREWISGFNNPLGMLIHGDTLYVVERNSLAEVSIPEARILRRLQVPGSVFLNDIAMGPDGILYLTDSFRHVIFARADSAFPVAFQGPEIRQPNGLHARGEVLVFGNTGDNSVKAIDLRTKKIRTIARLSQGIVDGIESDGDGGLLVSHNEGRLFHVAPDGTVSKLLDTTAPGVNCANFACIPSEHLLVVPSFTRNTLAAYRYRLNENR